MKKIRKIFVFILLLLFSLTLTSCLNNGNNKNNDKEIYNITLPENVSIISPENENGKNLIEGTKIVLKVDIPSKKSGIKSFKIDGMEKVLKDNQYEFEVSGNHIIEVSFTEEEILPSPNEIKPIPNPDDGNENKPSVDPDSGKTDSEKKLTTQKQILKEIETILKNHYYKEITDDHFFFAYLRAITEITDKYTGLDFGPSVISVNTNPEGGYGITIAYYEDKEKNIKGLMVDDISAGLLAEDDLIKDPLNALVPGDIIVGFDKKLDDGTFEPCFFGDEFSGETINIIKIDKEENPQRSLYVYNPLRDGEFNKENLKKEGPRAVMRYGNYPKHKDDVLCYKNFPKNTLNVEDIPIATNKNISYVRFNSFNDKIIAPFGDALTEIDGFLTSENDELIIDLRGNPGGDLYTINSLLAYFIPSNYTYKNENNEDVFYPLFVMAPNAVKKEIDPNIYTDDNNMVFTVGDIYRDIIDEKKLEYRQAESFKKYKIKILVDSQSASASEVFASVMKEHVPTASIYGETTFGKDIFQRSELLQVENYLIRFTFTEGKWGYYKKGVKDLSKYSLITEKGSEIITKESDNYALSKINYFRNLKPFINKNLKIDTVSNDNIWLSKFLQRVIYDNIENEIFTKYQEHKEKLEKEEYLRTDGYFDKNIEDALVLVKKFLKITSNDDISYMKEKEYNYQTYSYFYKYYHENGALFDQFNYFMIEKALAKNLDNQLIMAIKK